MELSISGARRDNRCFLLLAYPGSNGCRSSLGSVERGDGDLIGLYWYNINQRFIRLTVKRLAGYQYYSILLIYSLSFVRSAACIKSYTPAPEDTSETYLTAVRPSCPQHASRCSTWVFVRRKNSYLICCGRYNILTRSYRPPIYDCTHCYDHTTTYTVV